MLTHALSLHFLFPTRSSTCCNPALLLKLLAVHFAALSLVKPVTSRPASGERFLVCRGFAGDGDGDGNAALPAVVAHLLAANRACAEAEEAEDVAAAAERAGRPWSASRAVGRYAADADAADAAGARTVASLAAATRRALLAVDARSDARGDVMGGVYGRFLRQESEGGVSLAIERRDAAGNRNMKQQWNKNF